jgi:hypothetical protein
MCLFEFIRVEGGVTFMKHFKGGHKFGSSALTSLCHRTFNSYSVLGMEGRYTLTLENATFHCNSNTSGRNNFFFVLILTLILTLLQTLNNATHNSQLSISLCFARAFFCSMLCLGRGGDMRVHEIKQHYLHNHSELDTWSYELFYSLWPILSPPKVLTFPHTHQTACQKLLKYT